MTGPYVNTTIYEDGKPEKKNKQTKNLNPVGTEILD